jgi:putative MATE family efflux protein
MANDMKKDRSWMLGNERIGRLLLNLSAPAMVGMIVMALYNLVDTIFVGQAVGPLAIAGLSIVFPIQIIIMAVAQTVGVGGASIISRSLGAKKIERARITYCNVVLIVLITGVLITVLGLVFITPLLNLFGATKAIFPFAKDYLSIVLFGAAFFSFAISGNNIVRSEGNAKVAMISMIISGLLNIILDAYFIFVLKLGVKGAALATVLSQLIAAVYLLIYFIYGDSMLKYRLIYFKPNKNIIKETFAIGASTFARHSASSISIIVINNSLKIYGGDIAIAAFGVIHRVMRFISMPMFGIVQGLQPILGFNYGAKQIKRVKGSLRLAMVTITLWSLSAFLLLMIFPELIISIFTTDAQLLNLGNKALRIIFLLLPLIGFQIIGTGLFQSLGKAWPAMILALSRQVLFLLPAVLFLPIVFRLNGIWFAFPMADLLSTMVTAILFVREIRHLNKFELQPI